MGLWMQAALREVTEPGVRHQDNSHREAELGASNPRAEEATPTNLDAGWLARH